MTPNVQAFKRAMASSPVVSGRVVSFEHGGAHYRLANGRAFELTAEECRAIGTIQWKLPPASSAERVAAGSEAEGVAPGEPKTLPPQSSEEP